jgi:predicted RNA-binding Zn ribbon-like protein
MLTCQHIFDGYSWLMATENGSARTADYTFDLSGGRLCLDFANTVGDRGAEPNEHLGSYGDLIAWAEQAGAIAPREARALLRRAAERPAVARRALAEAIELREALYRVFAAVATGRSPRAPDLAIVNAAVPAAFERSRLVASKDGFTLAAGVDDDDLAAPLTAVVRSAIDLITSPDVDRVRTCAAVTCAWLFLDTTKNRARRWCDMKTCGNREKVRRFRGVV